MKITRAEFTTSMAKFSPDAIKAVPRVAIAGRSNVGKSSFINYFANRGGLAKTSSTPGKTKLLNFFEVNGGEFYLVDLPGYGFAKASDALSVVRRAAQMRACARRLPPHADRARQTDGRIPASQPHSLLCRRDKGGQIVARTAQQTAVRNRKCVRDGQCRRHAHVLIGKDGSGRGARAA